MKSLFVGKEYFVVKYGNFVYFFVYLVVEVWFVLFFEGLFEMLVFFVVVDEEVFEDNFEEYIRRDLEGFGMCFGFLLLVF